MVVVKRKTSKCCLVMSLLRKMVFIALKQNILIKAEHIPGRQKLTLSDFETGNHVKTKSRFRLQNGKSCCVISVRIYCHICHRLTCAEFDWNIIKQHINSYNPQISHYKREQAPNR